MDTVRLAMLLSELPVERTRLLDNLGRLRREVGPITPELSDLLADHMNIRRGEVHEVVSFYSFLQVPIDAEQYDRSVRGRGLYLKGPRASFKRGDRLELHRPGGQKEIVRVVWTAPIDRSSYRRRDKWLFNEGYKASHGEELIRKDLCAEAIRLTTILVEHPAVNQPKTHALLALMLLSGARLPARVDAEGNLLLLADQDRSRWDAAMIQRGLWHLNASASGEEISEFHLQAGIAYCHCSAQSYQTTDWGRILALYDLLAAVNQTPVVALNRAVAVSKVRGPEAGLKAVEEIRDRDALESYYLLHAVIAQFHYELRDYAAARGHFERALQLTGVTAERKFLSSRLEECQAQRAAEQAD